MTTLREIQKHFFHSLSPQFDKEEIENYFSYSCTYLLGYSRSDAILKIDQRIHYTRVKKFYSVVAELKTNKPIQYIFGRTEVYGLPFFVNKHVLIPRQETEELVRWIIDKYKLQDKKYKKNKLKILDIGTGSGLIAISLKKNISFSNVTAIDVSENALIVAEQNARCNKVKIDYIKANIIKSNFSKKFPINYFDVIVSNPPYVLQSEKKLMHKNVLDYEPHLALFVEDNNPLLFYDAIANFALQYLAKDGNLFFEINESLGNDVAQLLANKGFQNVEVKKDLNGKDRMIRACKL